LSWAIYPVSKIVLNKPGVLPLDRTGRSRQLEQQVRMGRCGQPGKLSISVHRQPGGAPVKRLSVLAHKKHSAARLHLGPLGQPGINNPSSSARMGWVLDNPYFSCGVCFNICICPAEAVSCSSSYCCLQAQVKWFYQGRPKSGGETGAEEIITVNQKELLRRQCFLNLKTIRKAL
jgi:hypothetical protein